MFFFLSAGNTIRSGNQCELVLDAFCDTLYGGQKQTAEAFEIRVEENNAVIFYSKKYVNKTKSKKKKTGINVTFA